MQQKRKIINDPVFGFVNIPDEFIYELIQHPCLQRLNRIRQLGMASYVYPGAQHTRFHHTIGAMYLMDVALLNLRDKGHEITKDEYRGALAAILMHDIGHTPFSHVLENTLANNVPHEEVSLLLMQQINDEKKGALQTAIDIFRDKYPKRFLHELVSGQLDVDRLDYLQRDSFFTGVSEGGIGAARIMKMLDVIDDKLVVESKGIYSIENFLMSRRFMYWQVYLHKTAVASEKMLTNTINRAKYLSRNGEDLFASPSLAFFLKNDITLKDFRESPEVLEHFTNLDDNDIWTSLKVWKSHSDKVLSLLSHGMVNRKLFKIQITNEPHPAEKKQEYIEKFTRKYGISESEAAYFVSADSLATDMYNKYDESIKILYRDGSIKDISTASDMFNIELLSKKVEKYYFAYLRD
ncbi:hypothetical protein DSECCO2_283040 [anaerobic digester metagenome]